MGRLKADASYEKIDPFIGCKFLPAISIVFQIKIGQLYGLKFFNPKGAANAAALLVEFMPYFSSIEPIVASIKQLLKDKEKLAQMSNSLTRLTQPLAEKKARNEVAKIIVEMLR